MFGFLMFWSVVAAVCAVPLPSPRKVEVQP